MDAAQQAEAAPPPFEPFLPAREITRSPLSPRRETARDAQREDVTTAGDDLPEADASLPGSAAAARVTSARAADAGDSTVAIDRAGRAEANIAVARGSVACGVRRRRLSAFYPLRPLYESVETKRRASPGGFYAKIRLYVRLDGFYSSLRVLVLVAIPVGSGFRGKIGHSATAPSRDPVASHPAKTRAPFPPPAVRARGARHDVVVEPQRRQPLRFSLWLFSPPDVPRSPRISYTRVRPSQPPAANTAPSSRTATHATPRVTAPVANASSGAPPCACGDGRAKTFPRVSFSQRTIRLRESSREPRELCDEARRRPRTR